MNSPPIALALPYLEVLKNPLMMAHAPQVNRERASHSVVLAGRHNSTCNLTTACLAYRKAVLAKSKKGVLLRLSQLDRLSLAMVVFVMHLLRLA